VGDTQVRQRRRRHGAGGIGSLTHPAVGCRLVLREGRCSGEAKAAAVWAPRRWRKMPRQGGCANWCRLRACSHRAACCHRRLRAVSRTRAVKAVEPGGPSPPRCLLLCAPSPPHARHAWRASLHTPSRAPATAAAVGRPAGGHLSAGASLHGPAASVGCSDPAGSGLDPAGCIQQGWREHRRSHVSARQNQIELHTQGARSEVGRQRACAS
jgi:hypothetical protein